MFRVYTHTDSEVLVPRPDYDFDPLEPAHAVFSVGASRKPIGIQGTPLINFTSLAKTGTTPGRLGGHREKGPCAANRLPS